MSESVLTGRYFYVENAWNTKPYGSGHVIEAENAYDALSLNSDLGLGAFGRCDGPVGIKVLPLHPEVSLIIQRKLGIGGMIHRRKR